MTEEVRMSHGELNELLQGDIGRQVRQLALQTYSTGITAHTEIRGERISPRGMTEAIALLAVHDFLDLCFGLTPSSRDDG